MDSNDELKQIGTKNQTCCYFDDIFKIEYFNPDNILINEKLCENILVYNIDWCSTFNKIDGFIRVYDGTTILVIIFWDILMLY